MSLAFEAIVMRKATARKATRMLDEYVYDQPGHLIRRAHQLAWAMFREETSEFDVTPVQYSLLVAVHDFPAIDATRLSELICIDRATIGNIVMRLEAKQLVAREDDPNDKRAKKIYATDTGRELVRSVNKVRGKIAERLFAPLDVADQMMLIKLLSKLVNIDDVKRRSQETEAETSTKHAPGRRSAKRKRTTV